MTRMATEKSESRWAVSGVVPCVPAQDVPDRDLVAWLRQRDERGFDGAYARYAERIFGFLVRLARSRAVAEDLFQHTFLRLAERGPRLRQDSDLRAWLFCVARNALHSHARAGAVAARAEPSFSLGNNGTGPEFGLVLNELDAALNRLETGERELLLLVGVEDLDPREVAMILDIDPATLRKRLSRARARLALVLDSPHCVVPKWTEGR